MARATIENQSFLPPAQDQITTAIEDTLHSANCGLVIHRVAQIRNEYRAEGREFARTLQTHLNRALYPHATTLLYEELFGVEDRFHWLVHMKAPNDYAGFIRMADHDQGVRKVVEENRLPQKGGGNWERIFEEGSFRETVMIPQHGIVRVEATAELAGLFVPPARFQTSTPPDTLLHTANAGVIIQRTAQLRYAFRDEGRQFAYEWQDYLNHKLAGAVTILLYEETWGQQDRIYWLMHLRSLGEFSQILTLAETDEDYRQLFAQQRATHKGPGTWARMFVDGSIRDTVLAPHHKGMGISWP
jgi:hypothetical protein